jgi:hypothetical protein
MNYPKDETLGKLAKIFPRLPFQTKMLPKHQTAQALSALTAKRDVNQLRNVNWLMRARGGSLYMVRLYANGEWWTLASFSSDYLAAARLADMANHSMGPFRLRRQRPNSPDSYNFSVEQAEADWAAEMEIAKVLNAISDHLKDTGVLLGPKRQDATRATATKSPLHGNHTAVKSLLDRVDKIQSELSEMKAQHGQILLLLHSALHNPAS